MEKRTIKDAGRLTGSDNQDFGDVDFELTVGADDHAHGEIHASFGNLHAAMSHGECILSLPDGTGVKVFVVDITGHGAATFMTTEKVLRP